MIKSVVDLEVYRLSYQLAMNIFRVTRNFPREERYSLTDQVVRASRSIAANIAEGWGKRAYENEFKKHLVYGMGTLEETKTWLNFAKDCNYLAPEEFSVFYSMCEEIGAKIFRLYDNWKTL